MIWDGWQQFEKIGRSGEVFIFFWSNIDFCDDQQSLKIYTYSCFKWRGSCHSFSLLSILSFLQYPQVTNKMVPVTHYDKCLAISQYNGLKAGVFGKQQNANWLGFSQLTCVWTSPSFLIFFYSFSRFPLCGIFEGKNSAPYTSLYLQFQDKLKQWRQ